MKCCIFIVNQALYPNHILDMLGEYYRNFAQKEDFMSTTIPIKDKNALEEFKNYYLKKGNYRNYSLIVMGLNTALRISDILSLKWSDVYNFSADRFKSHLELDEKKTGKHSVIALNHATISALHCFMEHLPDSEFSYEKYIFASKKTENKPIGRVQAYRIVKEAAAKTGLEEHISCHSLRKTFGYFAYKSGTDSVMLMEIYNHSSFRVTQRYLGIRQDERDAVFMQVNL